MEVNRRGKRHYRLAMASKLRLFCFDATKHWALTPGKHLLQAKNCSEPPCNGPILATHFEIHVCFYILQANQPKRQIVAAIGRTLSITNPSIERT